MLSIKVPSSGLAPIFPLSTPASPGFSKQAAISILSDQRSSVAQIATLFKQAFKEGQMAALNEAIHTVTQDEKFIVEEQLKNLMLDARIELVQHRNGMVSMRDALITGMAGKERRIANEALQKFLPKEVCGIVCAYADDQIEFSANNRPALKKALESDDIAVKERIIRQAGSQGEERFLNKLFREIRRENEGRCEYRLDLSGIDLSGLKLRGDYAIDFSYTDLSKANLQNADLESACLRGANLRDANLQSANLKDANLRRADLRDSQQKNTNFYLADLTDAIFFNVYDDDR